MAYDPTKLVSLKNLKDTATRIKTEFLAASRRPVTPSSRRQTRSRHLRRPRRTSCIL